MTKNNSTVPEPKCVIRHYFCSYFCPFSNQLHSTFLNPPFTLMLILLCFVSLCFHAHEQTTRTRFDWYNWSPNKLIYWVTDILKQSCCGPSSSGSCAGTSSAATEHSHHSKFRTSWTWSTSRSASTAQRLWVIKRFLATTAARSA